MIYHITAFIAGFILDLFLGDPISFPHPVRWIGRLISYLTGILLKENDSGKQKQIKGLVLVIIVITISVFLTGFLVISAYTINTYLGIIIETIISYQCLATKSLYVESMKVWHALKNEGLAAGQKAVSMIVGRDTSVLDEAGVIRACVETIAENTSDGVIAPLVYLIIGGPILGIAYKSINTMDSMIGYKNQKYIDFGRCAAKLDDIVNFVPARISAYIMILSCYFLGRDFDGKTAYRIFKRDRFNHASPNSAQTESVCAGALGLKLAGPASYFGTFIDKPFIGDETREIDLNDIKRANRLMISTAIICEVLFTCMAATFTEIIYIMIFR